MDHNQRLGEAAPELIRRELRTFIAEIEPALQSGNFDDLHAARIAGKRLRYDLEFFQTVLGAGARKAQDIMKQLQDRLGFIADATTFDRYYRSLLDELDERDPRIIGLLARRDAVHRERAHELDELRALWSPGNGKGYGETLVASINSVAPSRRSTPASSNGGSIAGATASKETSRA